MNSLKGQFLVAMPSMGDERFRESVIYLVGHGDEGAMGLMINQPLEDMRFGDILDELDLGDHHPPGQRTFGQRHRTKRTRTIGHRHAFRAPVVQVKMV